MTINICDRLSSRFYRACEFACPRSWGDLAALGGALSTFLFSSTASIAASIGYIGYKSFTSKKWSIQVEDLPYPTKRLNDTFYIRSSAHRFPSSCPQTEADKIPGIIKFFKRPQCENKACYDYVSEKKNIPIDYHIYIADLIKNGYEQVESPCKGDIILYVDCNGRSKHIGIIREIDFGIIWIESKWGWGKIYLHLEEAVPYDYGDSVLYFRK